MVLGRFAPTDVVAVTMSFLIICLGLLIASIALATWGVDIAGVNELPANQALHWTWWITHAPLYYPSAYLTGSFLAMLFVFRVYMNIW